MNKTVITYHKVDFDGEGSCSIAKEYLLQNGYTKEDIELYPVNHGDDVEKYLEFIKGKDVILVDFSFTPDNMKKLMNYSNYLIWIDHHVTPIREMEKEGLNNKIKGIRDVKYAAIVLTWKFFFPDRKIPKIIHYLGEFDAGVVREGDDFENFAMPLQFGIETTETDPLIQLGYNNWRHIINAPYARSNKDFLMLVKRGRPLYKRKIEENKKMYGEHFFEKEIFGHKAIVLETRERGSLLFKGFYFKDKHDMMVRFHKSDNDGSYHFSFYTDKDNMDLTTFARGHKKAAGMVVENLDEVFV